MSRVRRFSSTSFLAAPSKADNEAVTRLVVASFRNGSMPEAERRRILEAAQQANVTESAYLRGRLLLQANVPEAAPDDQE